MRGWMIWLLVLAVLWLLAYMKVGVHILYSQKQLKVDLTAAWFRIELLGGAEKKKRSTRKSKKKKNKAKKQQAPKKVSEKKNYRPWIDAARSEWREILRLISKVLRSPTLDVLRVEALIGGEPDVCAIEYGKDCAIIGSVLPVVESFFYIRKQKVDVYPCFDRDGTEFSVETAITLRIYEGFGLAFSLLRFGFRLFQKSKNNIKAVQKDESSSS